MIRLRFDKYNNHDTLQQLIDKGCKKLLIEYTHGLGDALMFLPYFYSFKEKNKQCTVDIKLNPLISDLYSGVQDDSYYDYIVWIPAHFNEVDKAFQGLVKPQCNCKFDLGIPYDTSLQYSVKPVCNKGLVGINLYNSYNTGGADNINCSEQLGRHLWNTLQQSGFICIDLFVPKDNNARRSHPKNLFNADWSMSTKGLGINKLIGLMSSFKGAASVATGTFHLGMTMYPQKVLYLKNKFPASCFTRKFDVLQLDVNKPDEGIIKQWIRRLSE